MIIKKIIDIEDECRKALKDYLNVYVRPLPAEYALPCILISASGGNTANEIDSPILTIDARAETDAEAFDYLTTALGILEKQAKEQTGALRNININSLARWGNDPARPDLKLCTATVIATVHRESFEIDES